MQRKSLAIPKVPKMQGMNVVAQQQVNKSKIIRKPTFEAKDKKV